MPSALINIPKYCPTHGVRLRCIPSLLLPGYELRRVPSRLNDMEPRARGRYTDRPRNQIDPPSSPSLLSPLGDSVARSNVGKAEESSYGVNNH